MSTNVYYYNLISEFYKGKHAKRSGRPYIAHIDEGILIADEMEFTQEAKDAFALHPMFQSDEALKWSYGQLFVNHIDPYIMMLVMEYRNKANAYLSWKVGKKVEQISLSPIPEVNEMLVMDKVQNRYDFDLYHLGKHERSQELKRYFDNWLERLGISERRYKELKRIIDKFREAENAAS